MDWILLIAIAGALGVSDVQVHRMTEAQCLGSLEAMQPLKPSVGIACVSPSGEVFE